MPMSFSIRYILAGRVIVLVDLQLSQQFRGQIKCWSTALIEFVRTCEFRFDVRSHLFCFWIFVSCNLLCCWLRGIWVFFSHFKNSDWLGLILVLGPSWWAKIERRLLHRVPNVFLFVWATLKSLLLFEYCGFSLPTCLELEWRAFAVALPLRAHTYCLLACKFDYLLAWNCSVAIDTFGFDFRVRSVESKLERPSSFHLILVRLASLHYRIFKWVRFRGHRLILLLGQLRFELFQLLKRELFC